MVQGTCEHVRLQRSTNSLGAWDDRGPRVGRPRGGCELRAASQSFDARASHGSPAPDPTVPAGGKAESLRRYPDTLRTLYQPYLYQIRRGSSTRIPLNSLGERPCPAISVANAAPACLFASGATLARFTRFPPGPDRLRRPARLLRGPPVRGSLGWFAFVARKGDGSWIELEGADHAVD